MEPTQQKIMDVLGDQIARLENVQTQPAVVDLYYPVIAAPVENADGTPTVSGWTYEAAGINLPMLKQVHSMLSNLDSVQAAVGNLQKDLDSRLTLSDDERATVLALRDGSASVVPKSNLSLEDFAADANE